jgi:hypothetical protein
MFHTWAITIILFLSIIAGFAYLWRDLPEINFHLNEVGKAFIAEVFAWKIVILLTVLIVIQTAITCFLPLKPNSDAAAFYMVLPKLFAEAKEISLLGGYEAFTTIGLHGEFHFAALMSLGCDWGAKFFTWPIALSGAVLLAALASRLGVRRRGQWLVMTMVFTSTAFILLIGDGKVDLFGAAMACAAFLWVFQGRRGSDRTGYIVAGLFAGFAVIAKISYLPMIIPSLAFLIIWNHFAANHGGNVGREHAKSLISKYGWLLIGMSLPVLVHLLKNWSLFQEPLAPFLYFAGDPYGGNWANQVWYSSEITQKIIFTYPLALIYGQYPMQYGTMSVLLLAFAPLAILLGKPEKFLKSRMFQISVLGVLGILVWIVIRPAVFAPRYILYTLLLLIPFVASCVERVLRYESKPRYLSVFITFVCVFYLIGYNGMLAKKIEEWNTEAKLGSPIIRASEKLNSMAKPGARILSLNYFTYWFRPDLLKSLSTSDEKQYVQKTRYMLPSEIWSYVHDRGFQYVFIDQKTHGAMAQALDVTRVPEWLTVKEIFSEQDCKIYQMIPKSQNHKIMRFEPGNSNSSLESYYDI